MSGMSMETVISMWPHGRVIISRLDPGTDYTGLANYITKEPPRGEHKKRWRQSRNIQKPKIIKKEVKHGGKLINPPKGYKIIQQDFYSSDDTGTSLYVKAIKIGGADYAGGKAKGDTG
jgi:hypothetical protein